MAGPHRQTEVKNSVIKSAAELQIQVEAKITVKQIFMAKVQRKEGKLS